MTIEELNRIKENGRANMEIRTDEKSVHFCVGMGNSGLAAGARQILKAMLKEVSDAGLNEKVLVTQSAKISDPEKNPVIEISANGHVVKSYSNVTTEMIKDIVNNDLTKFAK